MIVPFDQLPDNARVWIYQADRILNTEDVQTITEESNRFLEGWAAHGAALKSSFKILHNKFLIVSVDESFNQASGCSIDASVGLVKTLEQKLKLSFFNRSQVCFIINDEVFESTITEIKSLIQEGKINRKTLTFNNLVPTIKGLQEDWVVPAEDSWLKRYF
ncbi:hypothetical protein SAMN04488028_102221 [Reichenbachiella agariperforans]|uniref:ABC transporter ATPase n=1 Tax=Reichenbachiella agariperforans TaxID=156994 RepID=A0A1M6NE36_REIAG|nr:hypothetical protein [Reichenbachiella agariperforans]SHJ93960.1 hypothetical protein SAMN04488028_102221 [Reichenbachiella agariperforans]